MAKKEPKRTMWQPRPYETRAVKELRILLTAHECVLAVGPTGCGKTVIASMLLTLMKSWRVLFVVHRYELADQAYKALRASGVDAGIIMAQEERMHGSHRADTTARVQVASVQTLVHRPFDGNVDLIVVDEAHRVMAESYQAILRQYPRARVLGLTATPERADGKGLSDVFRHLFVIALPSELQRDDYLADPRWFGARADVVAKLAERLKGTRVSNGDYAPADLARAVDSKFLLGSVVSETLRIAPGVRKAVFAGSVAHSRKLAAAFKRKGVKAAHLDAEVPPLEREAMLEEFAKGDIEVICNFDVLSEGWDLPALGAVVLARPFRSRTRYLQVVGRGMRPRVGSRPIVIDHGNNAPRFGIWPGDDIEWSLTETKRAGSGEPPWTMCDACLTKIPAASLSCPECGAECREAKARRERDEAEAQLEEATRAQYLALRARVEKVAAEKGAPQGWVDKVMREIAA